MPKFMKNRERVTSAEFAPSRLVTKAIINCELSHMDGEMDSEMDGITDGTTNAITDRIIGGIMGEIMGGIVRPKSVK